MHDGVGDGTALLVVVCTAGTPDGSRTQVVVLDRCIHKVVCFHMLSLSSMVEFASLGALARSAD
jgi:hypothetical protein